MTPGWILATDGAVLAGAMLVLWLLSLAVDDVSIVDIFWGVGFVGLAWVAFALAGGGAIHDVVIACMVSAWGLRLAGYLAWRNIGKGEDYRYREMRARAGPRFRWTSAFSIFGLQGVLIWIVSLPVQVSLAAGLGGQDVTPMHCAGVACWLIGVSFETVGDLQLARFKANPENRGKVLDHGMWRYTRHPNYFGDFMVWWGLYIAAMVTPSNLLTHGWTAIGPIIMSILLMRVSGVTLLEKSLRERRPGYAEYIRRTSAFFPWPPRTPEPPVNRD